MPKLEDIVIKAVWMEALSPSKQPQELLIPDLVFKSFLLRK